jgi:predicted TIM-barrel fold metal-dependent hydrolase
MEEPAAAATELHRCIRELNFLGALVDGHARNNLFYDGPEYDVLWSAFQELDVPIYLHPTYPQISQVNVSGGLYTPDHQVYTEAVAAALSVAGWGWHSDNGIAFVRMWLSGVFDRHPNLKIVLGHMGEMVPYMLHRVQYVLGSAKPKGLTVLDAWERNIWVTTSGFFSLVPFRTLLAATNVDRIMVSRTNRVWVGHADGKLYSIRSIIRGVIMLMVLRSWKN